MALFSKVLPKKQQFSEIYRCILNFYLKNGAAHPQGGVFRGWVANWRKLSEGHSYDKMEDV
jgi:hypothetical protein